MTKQNESSITPVASSPVMVIEDDPALRERIDTLLEGGGYPVVRRFRGRYSSAFVGVDGIGNGVWHTNRDGIRT